VIDPMATLNIAFVDAFNVAHHRYQDQNLAFQTEELFHCQTGRKGNAFYTGSLESFRMNLSESTFWPNWNLSEWNLSEGIFQNIFSAKPEIFRI
jgi:hypothetical protein